MRIGAWVSSGAVATDSIEITVHVSMDKIGYALAWHDFIEPGAGTTPELLADATTTKRIMSVPGGKLYGWNYMRLSVVGDKNHNLAGMACRLWHYYRMWAVPDWPQHSRVRYKAR
jgi:hypothetical protein